MGGRRTWAVDFPELGGHLALYMDSLDLQAKDKDITLHYLDIVE